MYLGYSELTLGLCAVVAMGVLSTIVIGGGKFLLSLPEKFRRKDPAREAKHFKALEAAADQGNPQALFDRALYYVEGKTVERNLEEAAKLWRQSAERGYLRAQYNYGLCCLHGIGVKKDLREAVRWLDHVVTKGEVSILEYKGPARFELATTKQDKINQVGYHAGQASSYTERGAWRFALGEAEFLLGLAYYQGDGFPQDRDKAIRWWKLAAKEHNEDARIVLNKIKEFEAAAKTSP